MATRTEPGQIRYSYTALILSLIVPEVTLEYWDYQGRASYALGPGQTVQLFAFGAFDLFEQEGAGSGRRPGCR